MTTTHNNPVYEKLHDLKLSELMTTHDVVVVSDANNVEFTIKLMSDHGIHSCPVINKDGTCVGIIDFLDIVKHVITVSSDTIADAKELITTGRAIALKQVKYIFNESGNDPFVPLEENDRASLALAFFSKGVHRTPIFDNSGTVVGSVSQSDLIKWLYEQSNTYLKHMECFDKKITDLGLGMIPVVTVKNTDTTLDVLKTIDCNSVSAVPIVNFEGELVANFSAVDLKGMVTEKWPSLNLPVFEYLQKHSPSSITNVGLPKEYATLRIVLEFFHTYSFHRVWILDNSKPVGVISHTDVMKFFMI